MFCMIKYILVEFSHEANVHNLVLCLNRELIKIIDYKFMLKLQCKTTFNYVFVGKKNHQSRTRVDFGIMHYYVLHKHYENPTKYKADHIIISLKTNMFTP
jgi:hypothetical protein